MIPEPAYTDDGGLLPELVIGAYLARGGFGLCVMCGYMAYDWWDLSLTGLPPVTDRSGTLTDQVPLHRGCVAELRAYWGSIRGSADPGAEAPEPVTRDRSNLPDPPPVPTQRRRRTGAYERRRSVLS